MGNQRKAYTPEYNDEAVKLATNTGRPAATVARELGIVEHALGNWVQAYRDRHEAGVGALSETERAELVRLRKEVSELKMDSGPLRPPPPRCLTRADHPGRLRAATLKPHRGTSTSRITPCPRTGARPKIISHLVDYLAPKSTPCSRPTLTATAVLILMTLAERHHTSQR